MSQKYKTLVLNAPLVPQSAITSDSIRIDGNQIMATLTYSGLADDTITAKLLQSIDDINYADVPDSLVSIDKRAPSHTWNVHGLVHGCFVKVTIIIPSACTDGTFDLFNLLAHD